MSMFWISPTFLCWKASDNLNAPLYSGGCRGMAQQNFENLKQLYVILAFEESPYFYLASPSNFTIICNSCILDFMELGIWSINIWHGCFKCHSI